MRLLRGSGIAGLSAMARETERDGIMLARPFLDLPKSRLVATLNRAGIAFADDPTNRDVAFTRPRLRALLSTLAVEGADTRTFARLATRLARANAAVEVLTDGAARYLLLKDGSTAETGGSTSGGKSFDAEAFAAMPEEIRLRLLMRAIDRFGHEGPAELGKVEALLAQLDRKLAECAAMPGAKRAQLALKQTLAGALVSVRRGRIRIEPAPPRRGVRSI
jgi:tRNA(Ile)-lysidine synthase